LVSNESEALAQPVVESLREFALRTIGCDECQEVIGKLGLFFSGAPLRRSEGFCLKPFVGHNGSPKNRGTPVCTGSAAYASLLGVRGLRWTPQLPTRTSCESTRARCAFLTFAFPIA